MEIQDDLYPTQLLLLVFTAVVQSLCSNLLLIDSVSINSVEARSEQLPYKRILVVSYIFKNLTSAEAHALQKRNTNCNVRCIIRSK